MLASAAPRRLTVVLDRIEGDVAVLVEAGRQVHVPLRWLPAGVGEGTVLQLQWSVDPRATEALAQRVAGAQRRLVARQADGDAGDTIDL